MSETLTFYSPIEGTKHTVEVSEQNNSDVKVAEKNTYNGLIILTNNPSDSDEVWYELVWTMRRKTDNRTEIESDTTLSINCPYCGTDAVMFSFTGDEFEHLETQCSCGKIVRVLRDQPTESGQSHVINYHIQL